jgi:putative membrane protein
MIAISAPRPRWAIQYIGLPLLAMVVWDFLIVLGYKIMHWEWVGSNNLPLTLYGTAMSIILGFLNNYAYSRWWEARTLWGQIVNNSRSLARQVLTTMSPRSGSAGERAEVAAMQQTIVYYQIAFVHALRQQLRGLDPLPDIRHLVPAAEYSKLSKQKNVSLALQQRMGIMLREAHDRGWITEFEWLALDRNLDDLTDAQGGAERIKGTRMPMQYDFFPTLFVDIYCLLLPIGMVERLGWYTPLGSTLVAFMFMSLNKIGRDLQDPFDNKIYDVPLTAITKTIEINLRQLLGEETLPAPEIPTEGVLW